MIRRLALAAVVAAGLALTPVAAAYAGSTAHLEGHKRAATHHCQVAPKCRPHPLPKPPGGWPCAEDHSCGSKHHRPICPPVVAHPKPPVTHHHHRHVVVHHHHARPLPPVVTVASHSPSLPRTGGLYAAGLEGGAALVAMGAMLVGLTRQPKRQAAAVRSVL